MSGFTLSGPADADLDAILWHGLERFGERQTERYLTELEQTFAFLAEYPLAARLRADIDPPIRAYPHRAHVIIYDIEDDGILILRIRSGRENWTADPLGDAP